MKLHTPLICSKKIPFNLFFSLLDYNSFQLVANLAIEGLKQ
jgi:hypothetical protein